MNDNPSKDGVHCDNCHTELTTRKDDDPEVVLARLKVYHETTEVLKEYYARKGVLRIVIGSESVDETSLRTLEAIGD